MAFEQEYASGLTTSFSPIQDLLSQCEFGMSMSRFTFHRIPGQFPDDSRGADMRDAFYATNVLFCLRSVFRAKRSEFDVWRDSTGTFPRIPELYAFENALTLLEENFGIEPAAKLEERVQIAVGELFLQVPEVRAIYFSKYLQELRFTVLTDNKKADDRLAEILLDKELEILGRFPEYVILFSYIPLTMDEKGHFVSPDQIQIFERQDA